MSSFAPPLYIDAHVHLHDPSNALADLRQAAAGFAAAGNYAQPAIIMLAERAGFDVFSSLESQLPIAEEREVLWFQHASQRIMLVAGRQIVTSEGLEVLGLGSRRVIPDGLPLNEVLMRLEEADALIVLPWGVGKWLGKRGRVVDACLAQATASGNRDRLFLGDNGGRPAAWRVRQFESGFKVLSGSDPLPLTGTASAIGRFGSLIEFALPEEKPLQALKHVLRQPIIDIKHYGRPASIARFLIEQSRLRVDRKARPDIHLEQVA